MSETIRIVYEGQTESVSASALLTSLLNFVSLIEEVKSELPQFRDKKLHIHINRAERGSFIVELQAVLSVIDQIKQIFGVDNIKDLLLITFALLLIKRHLRGEPPSKVEENGKSVVIYNVNGNYITVPVEAYRLAIKSESIDRLMEEIVEPLAEEPGVKGIEISTGEDERLTFDREEFGYLMEDNPLLAEDIQTITKTNQLLVIVKVVFEPNRKWEFVYEGNKISAYLKDKEFFVKIDKGERFGKGDKLLVDLEIKQVLDKELGVYLNEDYTIIKVHNHIPREFENQRLFP